MHRVTPFLMISFALASPLALSAQAPATASPAAARAALVAQCRPAGTPADSATLPIHETNWGAAGPHVLLVHGGVQGNLGGGPASFYKQEPLGAMGWRVTLFDRPGFGSSPSRGVDDQLADSVWLAAKFGDSAHVIAHSFGGGEAVLAAGSNPGAVRSLILVEPGMQPLLPFATDPLIRENSARSMHTLLTAKTPADLAQMTAHTMGTDGNGGPNRSEVTLQKHPDGAVSMGCTLLRAQPATAEQFQTAIAAIVKAGIPVLVITGGYNPGVDAAGDYYATLLHGKHVIVASPNHFVQETSPAEFNRVADAFMRAADARAAARPANR